MGKRKAPFASIIYLRFLMFSYYKYHKIPVDPLADGESKFIDVIQKRLTGDGIIKGESRNILYKLFGRPAQARIEDCEGLDVSKLDLLTNFVCEKLELKDRYSISDESPWLDFTSRVFQIPEYLDVQDKGYFKFLTDKEKIAVDGFILRMLNEIAFKTSDAVTYVVDMWNSADLKVAKGILQLDLKNSFASYNFYVLENEKLILRTTMRTNVDQASLKLNANNAFINLSEENPEKHYLSLCLILNIRDIRFEHLKYLKGVLTSTQRNGTIPLVQTALLERVDNFPAAISVLTNNITSDEIAFDLINTQIKVLEDTVDPLSNLFSYKVARVCKDIAGIYVFGFPALVSMNEEIKEGDLGTGLCQIESNGLVRVMSNAKGKLNCYVQNIYVSHEFVCFSHLVHSYDREVIKVDYCLKIEMDGGAIDAPPKLLIGNFNNIYNRKKCVHGDIAFIKFKDKNASLDDCLKVVPPRYFNFREGETIPLAYKDYIDEFTGIFNEIEEKRIKVRYPELKEIKYEEII